jgi:hypothetical protein
MPVVEEPLWKHPGHPGMIVVTGHASLDREGRLYLGYGEAREAVRRIPDIEKQCGEIVQDQAVDGFYGFLPVRSPNPAGGRIGFGLFQTRYAWNEDSDPELIRVAMQRLREFSETFNEIKVRMEFPGLDSGLASEEVSSLLIPLPPTVTICHQGGLERSQPFDFPGFKNLYVEVEQMLKAGRYHQAVEYLVANGFDIQSAMEQVSAVQRILAARSRPEVRTEQFSGW